MMLIENIQGLAALYSLFLICVLVFWYDSRPRIKTNYKSPAARNLEFLKNADAKRKALQGLRETND